MGGGCPMAVWGARVALKGSLVPVEPKQELCLHPRHRVKLILSAGVSRDSDGVCSIPGQPWRRASPGFKSVPPVSTFAALQPG